MWRQHFSRKAVFGRLALKEKKKADDPVVHACACDTCMCVCMTGGYVLEVKRGEDKRQEEGGEWPLTLVVAMSLWPVSCGTGHGC